jgi:hypothetical protein
VQPLSLLVGVPNSVFRGWTIVRNQWSTTMIQNKLVETQFIYFVGAVFFVCLPGVPFGFVLFFTIGFGFDFTFTFAFAFPFGFGLFGTSPGIDSDTDPSMRFSSA